MAEMLTFTGLKKWYMALHPVWRLLAIPVLIILAVIIALYWMLDRKTIDPVAKADARAKDADKARDLVISKETKRLDAELQQIQDVRIDVMEDNAEDAVDLSKRLAKDPRALAESMRRVGRGEKP